jgi:hypothetical protein
LFATEPTGASLAVVNSIGLNPGGSSVESFQINAAVGALVSVFGSFFELVSTPIGAAVNPATGMFYVYLGPNSLSLNPDYQQDGDLLTFTVNPLTGLLGDETGSAPRAPALPGTFTVALGALLIILVLRFYSEWSGLIPAFGPHASRWKIVYAMETLGIFVPPLFAVDGCRGAGTNAPAAQKSSIVTPSGTSSGYRVNSHQRFR